jgi:hypothetical protein
MIWLVDEEKCEGKEEGLVRDCGGEERLPVGEVVPVREEGKWGDENKTLEQMQ